MTKPSQENAEAVIDRLTAAAVMQQIKEVVGQLMHLLGVLETIMEAEANHKARRRVQ